MKRIALFPGSFDPFTKGHEDIVLRGLTLFDEIIIAIGFNSTKNQRYFPIDLMVEKIKGTFKNYPQIKVQTYSELTAEYAKKIKQTICCVACATRLILNTKTALHRLIKILIAN